MAYLLLMMLSLTLVLIRWHRIWDWTAGTAPISYVRAWYNAQTTWILRNGAARIGAHVHVSGSALVDMLAMFYALYLEMQNEVHAECTHHAVQNQCCWRSWQCCFLSSSLMAGLVSSAWWSLCSAICTYWSLSAEAAGAAAQAVMDKGKQTKRHVIGLQLIAPQVEDQFELDAAIYLYTASMISVLYMFQQDLVAWSCLGYETLSTHLL